MTAPRRDKPTARKRRSALGSMLFGCGGLFTVLLAAGFGYLSWANAPLPPPDPDPPLPLDNAYHAWVAAVANRPLPGLNSPLRHPDTAPLADLRRELALPDRAGERVRGALSMEYRNPPLRDIDTRCPEVAHYGDLARRWTARARLARETGQPETALTHCLDSLELGSRFPHGGAVLHYLVGASCQFIPLYQAEQCIPHLSASAARSAGKRLDRILAQSAEPAAAMEQHRLAALATLRSFYRGSKTFDLPTMGYLQHPLAMAFYPKRLTYREIEEHYRKSIAEMRKPYPNRRRPAEPRHTLTSILVMDSASLSKYSTDRDAFLRLLRLELALQEYRAKEGRYPERLEHLNPGILASLPVDPFTLKAFPYRLTRDGYLLYSLGYDGVDDIGRSITNRKKMVYGPGDIVAGHLKEKD